MHVEGKIDENLTKFDYDNILNRFHSISATET